ncbi:MAG: hypothetical protein AAFQ67_04990 [Pseudomonadota bacterium]
MTLIRFIAALLAVPIIAVGIVIMIAPTPFGFIIVGFGLFLLAWAAPGAMRWLRRRWAWLDARLDSLQNKGPQWLSRLLKASDPPPGGP